MEDALNEVIRFTQAIINEATVAHFTAHYSMADMQAVA